MFAKRPASKTDPSAGTPRGSARFVLATGSAPSGSSKPSGDFPAQNLPRQRGFRDPSQRIGLANLESLNSVLIRQGLPQSERLLELNEIAITQMSILLSANNVQRLK